MKELKVEATRDNLKNVFSFLQQELEGCGCASKTKRQIKLCVEEIYMNISNYAYNPDTGCALITIDIRNDAAPVRAVISFKDKGKPYDPLAKSDPDLDSGLDDRPIGGLGIYLVKSTMDDMFYEYKDGYNILTVSKTLQQG